MVACIRPRWREKAVEQIPQTGGKKGSKRHLLVDERGVPLSIVVTGANRHDVSQLAAVLGGRIVEPVVGEEDAVEEHLCADAAYAGDEPEKIMRAAGYTPHVRPRGKEKQEKVINPDFKPRRWVVEVSHSWFNRFRKLIIRYEKLDVTHMALTHLAAAIIALRKVGIIYG